MKFRYLGNKETMVAFGYDFSNGAEPDVTDERAIAKLSGNSHFEAVESEEEGGKGSNTSHEASLVALGSERSEGADTPKKRGRKPKAE